MLKHVTATAINIDTNIVEQLLCNRIAFSNQSFRVVIFNNSKHIYERTLAVARGLAQHEAGRYMPW